MLVLEPVQQVKPSRTTSQIHAWTRLHPPRNWLHYLPVSFREKIIPWEKLDAWRAERRARKERLVVTNGCFDILHVGHVTYLEAARNQGDALLVGLTGDRWVRDIKGPGRPVNEENDRAAMLAALQSVDGVCIFPDKTALNFLGTVQPDVY